MSVYKKIHGRHQVSTHDNPLTAKQFLGKEEGVEGYTTIAEYKEYILSLREVETEDLERFFQYVKECCRIDGFTRSQTDKGGRKYMFPKFLQPKSNPGTKIILEAGMHSFILDYAVGKLVIDFTLNDLVNELEL